ncbi:TadE/TadG family type IV pilus assembly protein [Longispora urticae]
MPRTLHPRRPRRDDRGATSVEFAIAVPMIVLILAALTQGVLWGIGYLAAQSAADQAAQSTRVVGGSPSAGEVEARELLAQLAGNLVRDPQVTVTRGPAETTVVIHGTAKGLPLPIDVRLTAPTERFVP